MNVCRRKRKAIALLAVNALAGEPARQLRSHLETCPGCRQYLAEISYVGERIRGADVESIEASHAFHRKLLTALRRQEASSETCATTLQTLLSNWRVGVALSLILFATAAVVMLRFGQHQVPSSMPSERLTGAGISSGTPKDVEPTISNYSSVANRSLDQFDELLTQQANKHFASYPVYTAGGVSDPSLVD
jgi:anti-sigma factor RsiW